MLRQTKPFHCFLPIPTTLACDSKTCMRLSQFILHASRLIIVWGTWGNLGTQHFFGGVVAFGIAVWSNFSHEKPSQLPENLLSGESLWDVSRAEVFEPSEVKIRHVFARVVRRCFLLCNDPVTGKNYDHRKV